MANAKKLGCTWPEARLEPRRLRVADDYLQGVLDGVLCQYFLSEYRIGI